MRTLRVDGWNKVKAGITTIEEVLRVTREEVLRQVRSVDRQVDGLSNVVGFFAVARSGARALLHLEDAIGQTPRRNLPAHEILKSGAVEQPVLVRRGDQTLFRVIKPAPAKDGGASREER